MSQKRSRIIQEILDTEAGYLKSLQELQLYYFSPLRSCKKFSTIILDSLESNYDEILFVNNELNEQLIHAASAKEGSECIGLCFIALEQPFLKAYKKYYLNYENVSTLLRNEKKTNPEFDAYIEELRKKAPLQFGSYLIMPIQRIRYSTLLKVLIENTEKDHVDMKNLEHALQIIEEVTVHINTSLKSEELKEETIRTASLPPKKDKKYAAIEINGKEELLSLEVPSVSTHLSIVGQNQSAFVLKKYYEIMSQNRKPSPLMKSSGHSIEDYSYSEEAALRVEIVGTENQRIDGSLTTLYLVKIQGKHPETFNYIEYTLAKRYRDFFSLHEKFKEYFSMSDQALASSLPPFPQKKPTLFIDHLTQDFIQERRVQLELWIKAISAKYIDLDIVQQFFDIQNAEISNSAKVKERKRKSTEIARKKSQGEAPKRKSLVEMTKEDLDQLQEIHVKNLDDNTVVGNLLDFETGFENTPTTPVTKNQSLLDEGTVEKVSETNGELTKLETEETKETVMESSTEDKSMETNLQNGQ